MAQSPFNSGSPDLTTLINTLQVMNQILTRNGNTLAGGVAVVSAPPSYTVIDLPMTAANGSTAFASNGLKPGETTGSGTGVPVFFNGATQVWWSYLGVGPVSS